MEHDVHLTTNESEGVLIWCATCKADVLTGDWGEVVPWAVALRAVEEHQHG